MSTPWAKTRIPCPARVSLGGTGTALVSGYLLKNAVKAPQAPGANVSTPLSGFLVSRTKMGPGC